MNEKSLTTSSTIGLLLAIATGVSAADANLGYDPLPFDPQHGYTMFAIPFTRRPPTPDGVIDGEEWDQAFVISAQANQQLRTRRSSPPRRCASLWWISA